MRAPSIATERAVRHQIDKLISERKRISKNIKVKCNTPLNIKNKIPRAPVLSTGTLALYTVNLSCTAVARIKP